ncbi:MAG: hypothetical protein IJ309_01535 [Clostridia bacterium]|nr:hypothetical protein [Clostridia bacterium]
MKFLKTPITSEKVEGLGQKLYKISKWVMLIAALCFVTFFVVALILAACEGCEIGELLIFDSDTYIIPFTAISYLSLVVCLIGVGLYFSGINLYAVGRIAVNTEKKDK